MLIGVDGQWRRRRQRQKRRGREGEGGCASRGAPGRRGSWRGRRAARRARRRLRGAHSETAPGQRVRSSGAALHCSGKFAECGRIPSSCMLPHTSHLAATRADTTSGSPSWPAAPFPSPSPGSCEASPASISASTTLPSRSNTRSGDCAARTQHAQHAQHTHKLRARVNHSRACVWRGDPAGERRRRAPRAARQWLTSLMLRRASPVAARPWLPRECRRQRHTAAVHPLSPLRLRLETGRPDSRLHGAARASEACRRPAPCLLPVGRARR